MDPSVLTVYSCPFPKKRVGRYYDGGYIIAKIPEVKYDILISGGICGDISFEQDFTDSFNTKCIGFDGTIQGISHDEDEFEFVKMNIGFDNTETTTNLHEYIDKYNHIFIKMDIEGGEIPWIKSLTEEHMNKFEQIVMEFHSPFSEAEIEVFDKINRTHVLVHFHGNNCCGTILHRGVQIPDIFECTYVHKRHFTSPPSLNTEVIPSPIDMKNIREKDDIYIDYLPFVNPGSRSQS